MVMMPRRSCGSNISQAVWGRGGGLTKKPLIHVSTMVRLAGKIENHGMMGRGDVDSKLAGACCGNYDMVLV